jgi:uncharacterized OB-fold protein
MAEYLKPLPVLGDELSRTYWEAAREGRLLIQRCAACGEYQFYPRGHCVHCSAAGPEWIEANGTGRLHTFSVVHRTATQAFAEDVPYVVGILELDDGPRLTVNVVDTPLEELACDLPVRVVFTTVTQEITLPVVTRTEA